MTLLITGIHGFVGSNLVGYLSKDKDNTIYGLDIIAPEKPGVAKTFSWEDLDAGKVPEVDAHPSCMQSVLLEEKVSKRPGCRHPYRRHYPLPPPALTSKAR